MKRWCCIAVLSLIGSAAQAQEVLDADEWEAVMRATTPSAPEVKDARASLADKPARRGRKNSEQSRAAAAVDALGQPEAASGAAEPEARGGAHEQSKAVPAGKRGKRASAEGEKPSAETDGDKSETEKGSARGKRAKGDKAEKPGEGEQAKHAPGDAEKAGDGEQAKHAASEGEKGGRHKHAASAAAERESKASASAESEKGTRTKAGSEKSSARESAKSASGGKAEPAFKSEKSDRGVPANYVALKRSWHARWKGDSRSKMAGLAPALYIHPVHPVGANVAPYVLIPESTQGGFSDAQLAVASEAWGSYAGGPTVARRLLNLIYHAALHFDVFHVHLISGVRKDRGGSRHTHGLAADIVLPGVEDEELATYFRAQGFCGVGIYTRAGFTHIDTRDSSYFWLDWSLPGRKNRQQQIRGDEAKAADEAARARGQEEFVNPPRLQKALEARLRKRRAKSKVSAPVNQEGS